MKYTSLAIAFILAVTTSGFAQSQSFQTLEKKFALNDDVRSFSTSGFLARNILWLAGEHEFKKAIRQVKNIRIITIPKHAFIENQVSVQGFKKVIHRDSFEEVASVRDQGDDVSIFIQPLKNSSLNRYLILIDNTCEVVVVEIKGHIDVNLLNQRDANFSYKYSAL